LTDVPMPWLDHSRQAWGAQSARLDFRPTDHLLRGGVGSPTVNPSLSVMTWLCIGPSIWDINK
jgi:hypothetical protein